jgi:hypothetical protein
LRRAPSIKIYLAQRGHGEDGQKPETIKRIHDFGFGPADFFEMMVGSEIKKTRRWNI